MLHTYICQFVRRVCNKFKYKIFNIIHLTKHVVSQTNFTSVMHLRDHLNFQGS